MRTPATARLVRVMRVPLLLASGNPANAHVLQFSRQKSSQAHSQQTEVRSSEDNRRLNPWCPSHVVA